MYRLYFMVAEIVRKLSRDNITGYAAQSCFYIILSFFPCLLLLMSSLKFLPITAQTMITIIQNIAPDQLTPLLTGIINDIYSNSSLTFTFISAIATLWAAGKGFMSIIRCFDTIYEVHKKRNWLTQRFFSIIYTIIFILSILLSLALLVFGNQLLNFSSAYIPQIASVLSSILNSKLILFPSVLLLLFVVMYTFIPNRKSSIAKQFPGALIAAIGWYAFSFCYSIYVKYSPNFSTMYGSLTTLIFAMVWIYSCMVILFFGAEFNTFIDKHYLTPIHIKRKYNKTK